MNDDPIGTRTDRTSTADPWPHRLESVRKVYPDGTVREWYRALGGPWTELLHDHSRNP